MFNKILVPLDGYPLSESALAAAIRLVTPAGADAAAELLLLRVPVAERMVLTYPTQYSILNPEQSKITIARPGNTLTTWRALTASVICPWRRLSPAVSRPNRFWKQPTSGAPT